MEVAIGVDSHKASFTAAVVDGMGRSLGDVTLPNDPQGIDALGAWMKRYPEHVIGIEGSQRYGKALAKGLEARGESVFEVPASLTGRERKRRRNDGESDPVDAAAIARVVARGEGLAVARRDDVCVDLKLLLDHRDQLVHNRTELVNQTHSDLVVLAPGYQKKVPNLTTMSNLETAQALTRGDSSVRAQLVRRRIAGIKQLEAQIALLDKEIQAKLKESKSTLTEDPRCRAPGGRPHPGRGRRSLPHPLPGCLRRDHGDSSPRGLLGSREAPPLEPPGQPPAQSGPLRRGHDPGSDASPGL